MNDPNEIDISDRHPGTQAIARWFAYDHLPQHLQGPAHDCHDLAWTMIASLNDGPELTTGLRRLLEAKDCFVRALVEMDTKQLATEETMP